MRTVVILMALAIAGCSAKTTTTGATGDAVVGLGQDATATADAGGDGAGADVAPVKCVGPNDVHVCDTTGECASGMYCDQCSKTCKASRNVCDPCTIDDECAGAENGSICIPYDKGGTFCGQACLGDAGCPKAFTCKAVAGSASMQCVPKNGSCAPGSGLCKTDAACPFQFICNPDYGACVKGCTDDLSCPQPEGAPTVCSLGHCVTPCTGDPDCAPISTDAKCVAQHCKIPGGCLTSAECDTSAKPHCLLTTHMCVAGCVDDGECHDAGLKCVNGQCAVKGCTMNFECSFGLVCNAGTGQCETPTLPYCGKCDDQDQNVTACGGKPAICQASQDAAGNKLGPYCYLPCSTDPTGQCPEGYGCQDVKDQNGAVTGQVCFRQCQYQPQTTTP